MSFSTSVKKYIDPKLVLYLAGFYTLFYVVYLGKIAYMRAFVIEKVRESWYDILVNYMLFDWLVVVIYMTLIAISTKRLLNRNYSWIKIFLLHTVFSIFIGFVIRFVFDVQGIIAGHIDPSEYSLMESLNRMIMVIDLNFLIYFAMIFIIYTYYYLKQVKEAEKQKNQLETQLANTRMKMLSSQLQPHFLFNTLNSISVLVELDAKKAQNTIADLSDFLREILYSSEEYKVSLEKELRILEYYLNILTVRFSDHLKIEKCIDTSLLQYQVPALILQPVIENSVKHGYSYHHTKLEVTIAIYRENNALVIKVENNGEKLTRKHVELLKEGVGLANINDRLTSLYKEKYFFEVKNKEDGRGVITTIKLPI